MTRPTRPFHTLTALALVTCSVASCDPPIDPEVDSGLVADHAASVFESSRRALQAMDRPPQDVPAPGGLQRFAARLLNANPTGDANSSGGLAAKTGLRGLRRVLGDELFSPRPSLERAPAPRTLNRSEPPAGDELSDESQELHWIIKNRLLARNNVESQTPFEVIYRLRPEVTCAQPHGRALDQDCARFLGRVELRLRLTREGLGHAVELLVGAERVHPLTLFVDEREVAATTDLQALKATAQSISRALEEPDPGLPTVMRGTFRISLTREGARSAGLRLGLLDMIEVLDQKERFVFRTAAADRALVVRLDGETRRIEASAGVGLTEVIGPLDDNVNRQPPAPDLRVVVAGLVGTGTVDLGAEKLVFEGVGLGAGPSFAEVRGQRIVELNLNPQDRRVLDATVTFGPQGTPRLSLSPRFDLGLMFKLALIKDALSSPPPAHLEDETYRLLVDRDASGGPVLEAFEDEQQHRAGVRVVSGAVTLSSSRVGTPVTATAGMCLEPTEPAPGAHPVLGAVKVTTCQ